MTRRKTQRKAHRKALLGLQDRQRRQRQGQACVQMTLARQLNARVSCRSGAVGPPGVRRQLHPREAFQNQAGEPTWRCLASSATGRPCGPRAQPFDSTVRTPQHLLPARPEQAGRPQLEWLQPRVGLGGSQGPRTWLLTGWYVPPRCLSSTWRKEGTRSCSRTVSRPNQHRHRYSQRLYGALQRAFGQPHTAYLSARAAQYQHVSDVRQAL